MKILAIMAMVLVSIDCFERGAGMTSQVIFSNNNIWLWYVLAVYWLLAAFGMIFCKVVRP